MNKQQRKAIAGLVNRLLTAVENGMPLPELKEVVKTVVGQLEIIRDDEQEKFDNLSESLQSSSKGEDIQETIAILDEVIGDLGSIDGTEDGDEEIVGEIIEAAVENLEDF